MKKIAIIQSNYIPWKGYFDIVNMADEFIINDEAQYTPKDWRNRNRIKTSNGPLWLTIPVNYEYEKQKIYQVKTATDSWRRKHWASISISYAKAVYFKDFKEYFSEVYNSRSDSDISTINYDFILLINRLLGITTKISKSVDFHCSSGKNEGIINLCKQTGATEYISGPAAKSYINPDLFKRENIKLTWMDYSGYPEYKQLYPPFVHEVSIIDLIFNEGPNATKFMKSFGV